MTISANIVASKVLHSKQGHQKTAGDGSQTCHPLHTPETRITRIYIHLCHDGIFITQIYRFCFYILNTLSFASLPFHNSRVKNGWDYTMDIHSRDEHNCSQTPAVSRDPNPNMRTSLLHCLHQCDCLNIKYSLQIKLMNLHQNYNSA